MDPKQPRINRTKHVIVGVLFAICFIAALFGFSTAHPAVSIAILFVTALGMFFTFLRLLVDIHYIGFPHNE